MHLSAREGGRELLVIADILKKVMRAVGSKEKQMRGNGPALAFYN